jgi:hypothetical protein
VMYDVCRMIFSEHCLSLINPEPINFQMTRCCTPTSPSRSTRWAGRRLQSTASNVRATFAMVVFYQDDDMLSKFRRLRT